MNKILAVLLILLASASVYAQKGTTGYLDEKRGFKTFVLGSPISDYANIVEQVPGNPDKYTVSDTTMLHIGDDIKLTLIQITTFDGKILSIGAVAHKEYGSKIFSVLKSAYGMVYHQANRYIDNYIWNANTCTLSFNNADTTWCVFILKDKELDNLKYQSDKAKTQSAVDDL